LIDVKAGKVQRGFCPAAARISRCAPTQLITHRFTLDRILDAYDTFGRAADTGALKVIISA
jgi:threonine dehydrogenase-like Zn-dependent dehydrogenase